METLLDRILSEQGVLVLMLVTAVVALWRSSFNLSSVVRNNTAAMNESSAQMKVMAEEVARSSRECMEANTAVLSAFRDALKK